MFDFIKKHENSPMFSFFLGSIAGVFPLIIYNNTLLAPYKEYLFLFLYFSFFLIILFLSQGNYRKKLISTVAAIGLFALFLYLIPRNMDDVEILYIEDVKISSSESTHKILKPESTPEIMIRGIVSKKILPNVLDGLLNVYIIKFVGNTPYFESKEPAMITKEGKWFKKLGFISGSSFEIQAIVTDSPQSAEEHALAREAYLSEKIPFAVIKKE